MDSNKGVRPGSPPLHVHVNESTPVHVHVKKNKKPTTKSIDDRLNRLRSQSLTRQTGRCKSAAGPWIPPPAKSTKGNRMSWKGNSHSLEIMPTDTEAIINTEDGVNDKMRGYEDKIDHLMDEIGQLKTEAQLEKARKDLVRNKKELEMSRHILEEQEDELFGKKVKLDRTETENLFLRHSVERMRSDVDLTQTEKDILNVERDVIMKKLVEVEMESASATKQISALRDMLTRLRQDKKMTSTDAAILAKQRELLLDKLSDFEATNRTLRKLLREQHHKEGEADRLSGQRDLLINKLSEADTDNQRMKDELFEQEQEVRKLKAQFHIEKEQNEAMTNLQGSLEQTRAHLQKQLRGKESENNRMAVQMKTIENQLDQAKVEMDHTQTQLTAAKDKAVSDKEALKRATRAQKDRATRSESEVDKLNAQLTETAIASNDLQDQVDTWKSKATKLSKENAHLESHSHSLQSRLTDLEVQNESLDHTNRILQEQMNTKLGSKNSELSSTKLENERLRACMSSVEDKLDVAGNDVEQLKNTVRQYEQLIAEYKTQMEKSKQECDELATRVDQAERDNVHCQEQRYTENEKAEHAADQLDKTRDKLHKAHEEQRGTGTRLEAVERRYQEADDRNRDLINKIAKLEELNNRLTAQLDDKCRENASVARQLEMSLEDTRRQTDVAREKASSKERNTQSRIVDLEGQMSRLKTDLAQTKRNKEDAERKFNTRLQDMKDRLEQSHSTNRSMQNYIQFLKSSYANVFGEGETTSPFRSRSPLLS